MHYVGSRFLFLLAALGMMMFPIFTVYVTSIVQRANADKNEYNAKQNTGEKSSSASKAIAHK